MLILYSCFSRGVFFCYFSPFCILSLPMPITCTIFQGFVTKCQWIKLTNMQVAFFCKHVIQPQKYCLWFHPILQRHICGNCTLADIRIALLRVVWWTITVFSSETGYRIGTHSRSSLRAPTWTAARRPRGPWRPTSVYWR